VLERALDRSAARDQQLNEAISRALLLPLGSTQGGITVPQPSALKFMRWKADESGLENVDISTAGVLVVTDYAKTLLDDPDAATARATLGAIGASDSINFTGANRYHPTVGVTSSLTVNTSHVGKILQVNTSSGAVSITLPDSGITAGGAIWISHTVGANAVTLRCQSTASLFVDSTGPVVSYQLNLGSRAFVYFDGANWIVLTNQPRVVGAPAGGDKGPGTLNATALYVNGNNVLAGNTGVTPGTYGSSSAAPQITVDAQGRITAASNVALNFVSKDNGARGIGSCVWHVSASTGSTSPWSPGNTYTLGGLPGTWRCWSSDQYWNYSEGVSVYYFFGGLFQRIA
jgi:hypothetical protein